MANKDIAIISGPFLSAHAVLSHVVPKFLSKGFSVNIFMVPMPKRKLAPSQNIERFRFYEFDLLDQHVYPYLDSKPYSLSRTMTPHQVFALKGVTCVQVDDVNSEDIKNVLDKKSLLGTLSIHNPQVLNEASIDFFKKKGFLWNLHRGLLPHYRGLYIPFWAALNGEAVHGITLHDLVPGIDEGNIILSHKTLLDHKKSVFNHVLDLIEPGAQIVLDAFDQYVSTGTIQMSRQNLDSGQYYTVPSESQIMAASKAGVRLLPSPIEILKAYQNLFGHEEKLRDLIINGIVEFERRFVPEHEVQRKKSVG